jgi:hypothetical protein
LVHDLARPRYDVARQVVPGAAGRPTRRACPRR